MFVLLFPVDCPLKTAPSSPKDFHTHIHFVICPVTLQTACALLACNELWFSRGWNKGNTERPEREVLFFETFLNVFVLFFACYSAICSEINIGARSIGKMMVLQRPSVPDFSRLCGRRSGKIHTPKKIKAGSLQICNLKNGFAK